MTGLRCHRPARLAAALLLAVVGLATTEHAVLAQPSPVTLDVTPTAPSCSRADDAIGCDVAVTPDGAGIREDVREDADFLISLQLPDGAIFSDAGRTGIEPYLGNYAAWGLARATRYTGDPAYLDAAIEWLSWYEDHMDADGSVDDYLVVDGVPQSTNDHDSVDATSAVFLLAVLEAYWAAPAGEFLERFRPAIGAAVGAIEALRDGDGLTWVKPTLRVKYLMDNAETHGGMVAASQLGVALGDSALVTSGLDGAAAAKAGVAGLWNPQTQAYDWAEHANGDRQPTDWAMLYPDAVEQAWAVAYGVAESWRSSDLMDRFLAAQPNWDRPAAMATYWDGVPYAHPVGFWPVVGWAFLSVGEAALAAEGAAHIRDGARQIARQPPFTAGEQGQLILLSTGGVFLSETVPTTTVNPTDLETGQSFTVSATGVPTASTGYVLKISTLAETCPTGSPVGAAVNSTEASSIPETQRVVPQTVTSGTRWVCWVSTEDTTDHSPPVEVTIF